MCEEEAERNNGEEAMMVQLDRKYADALKMFIVAIALILSGFAVGIGLAAMFGFSDGGKMLGTFLGAFWIGTGILTLPIAHDKD